MPPSKNFQPIIINGITLQPRESDGYVNGTELCDALKLYFVNWRHSRGTKIVIKELSEQIGISEELLIKYETRKCKKQTTWVHVKLAIDMILWDRANSKLDVISKLYDSAQEQPIQTRKIDISHEEPKVVIKPKPTHTLSLNGITIEPRASDGYINGTALCKALGKQFKHWRENPETKALLAELSEQVDAPTDALIKYEDHGPKNRASWIGIRLAIDITYWSSSRFRNKAITWLAELMVYGSVTLGQEHTPAEIEARFTKQIKEIEQKYAEAEEEIEELSNRNYDLTIEAQETWQMYQKLEKNHTALLKKRKYPKFDTNNCFYLWCDPDHRKEKYKFGITDDINGRLRTYRVGAPKLQLKYLLYIVDNKHLEDSIRRKFDNDLEEPNHEIIIIDFKSITDYIAKYLDIVMCDHKLAICDDTPWLE